MTVIAALILEWLIGDPENRWHPVAWFGRWAAWCESFLYANQQQRGIIAWLFVVAVPLIVLWGLHTLLGWAFDALLLWMSMGWKSLFEHVRAVLNADSAQQARQAVSLIVSRDTDNMSEQDMRRAALESLAENASDAVVAPLFWFALSGPLGAACYRMMNTLDAMWGYKNVRYQSFGWFAARVDDIANYLPARITACLLLWMGKTARWSEVKNQADTHASPNAGWPEVALAFAADVRLGGDVMRNGKVDNHPFYGTDDAREADVEAACDALDIVHNALIFVALLACGVSLAF